MADNIPKRTEDVELAASAIAAWVRSIPDSWMRDWGSNSREEIASQIEGLAWAFGPILHVESDPKRYPNCGCTDGTDPDEPSDRGFICPHDPRGFAFSRDADEEMAAKWIGDMTSVRRLDQVTYENLAEFIRRIRMETISVFRTELSNGTSMEQMERLGYPEE